MKVQSGCRASRGSLMNTFPATWNKAMVRATRFLITNITMRRITWRRRGTHWSYQLWKWNPQLTFSHAAKTLWPPDLPWIWLRLWHSPAGPSRYQTPLPSRRWTRCRCPEPFCGPHRATRELQFPLETSEQKEPLKKQQQHRNAKTDRQFEGYRWSRRPPEWSESTPAPWRCNEWRPSWSGTELEDERFGLKRVPDCEMINIPGSSYIWLLIITETTGRRERVSSTGRNRKSLRRFLLLCNSHKGVPMRTFFLAT